MSLVTKRRFRDLRGGARPHGPPSLRAAPAWPL